jgi:hypothetical protein
MSLYNFITDIKSVLKQPESLDRKLITVNQYQNQFKSKYGNDCKTNISHKVIAQGPIITFSFECNEGKIIGFITKQQISNEWSCNIQLQHSSTVQKETKLVDIRPQEPKREDPVDENYLYLRSEPDIERRQQMKNKETESKSLENKKRVKCSECYSYH